MSMTSIYTMQPNSTTVKMMQLSGYGSSYTTIASCSIKGSWNFVSLRVISRSGIQIYTNFCFKKLINKMTCLTNESSSARALFHYVIYWKRVHGFISHLSELSSVLLVLLLLHYLWAVSRELRLAVYWQNYKHLTNIFCWGNQCTPVHSHLYHDLTGILLLLFHCHKFAPFCLLLLILPFLLRHLLCGI